jgi:hypothetical protein
MYAIMLKRMYAIVFRRTIAADVVEAIIVGGFLAHLTANRIMGSRLLSSTPGSGASGIIQDFFVGLALAFISLYLILDDEAKAHQTTTNGWSTIRQCNLPGNGILLRAACAKVLPMANVLQEAAYWTTTVDSTGRALSGQHNYVLHFPAGQLPPNSAFWSVTMTDVRSYMVPNPADRYSVSDKSGLLPNADGSLDIHIQHTSPAGDESNWLPAPPDDFKLWLRVYLPGAAILDGKYDVPPVVEVKG